MLSRLVVVVVVNVRVAGGVPKHQNLWRRRVGETGAFTPRAFRQLAVLVING